jgi:putative peptidoglycan lipid II flippase
MVVNAILSLTLPFIDSLELGVAGIALAFSVAGIVNAILLFIYLHEKIGPLDTNNEIFESSVKLVAAAFIMGLVTYGSLYLFDAFVDTSHVWGLLAQTFGAILSGVISYLLLTWLFKCEETMYALRKFGLKGKA